MKKYCCIDCQLTFDYPSLLDRHQRIHTRERTFKCALCPKSFIRADTLKTHMNIHQNKGYTCCGKTLHSRASYKYHLKTYHILKCPSCSKHFLNGNSLLKHVEEHESSDSNGIKTEFQSTNSIEVEIKDQVKVE